MPERHWTLRSDPPNPASAQKSHTVADTGHAANCNQHAQDNTPHTPNDSKYISQRHDSNAFECMQMNVAVIDVHKVEGE